MLQDIPGLLAAPVATRLLSVHILNATKLGRYNFLAPAGLAQRFARWRKLQQRRGAGIPKRRG